MLLTSGFQTASHSASIPVALFTVELMQWFGMPLLYTLTMTTPLLSEHVTHSFLVKVHGFDEV